jgi:carboxyl-terminal processing protease
LDKRFYLILTSGALVLFMSIGALLARTNPKDNSYAYLTIFSNVLHLVDQNYVEDVDFNKVMDSALHGMVENLDPESFFIKGSEIDSYKKEIEENKSKAGVGLTVSRRLGMVMVIAVEKDSPAAQANIKPGDLIRSVNDQYVQPLPTYRIYSLIKGLAGTSVKISIFKSALEKPQDFTLVRKATRKPYTESYVAQENIGYIGIRHLLPGIDAEVERKLEQYDQQGIKNLILDLRGCTEEDQDLALKVADLFIGATPLLEISGRDGLVQTINGDAKILYKDTLLVLADYTTSGGAEIIAGSIQDSGTGKILGVRTFGKGGIQKLIPAGQNYLVLTTEKYLTPKGKSILSNGVEPAIPYKEDVKSIDRPESEDIMLEKAIDYLRHPGELKKAA